MITQATYGMITRALRHFGLNENIQLSVRDVERLIKNYNISSNDETYIEKREFDIIYYRYGFEDDRIKLLKTASKEFGLTEKQISDIEKRICEKIILRLKRNKYVV